MELGTVAVAEGGRRHQTKIRWHPVRFYPGSAECLHENTKPGCPLGLVGKMHEIAPSALSIEGADRFNPLGRGFEQLQYFSLGVIPVYLTDPYIQDISRSCQGHENRQAIQKAKAIPTGYQALNGQSATISGYHLKALSAEAGRWSPLPGWLRS
jgi:hypothetical protein